MNRQGAVDSSCTLFSDTMPSKKDDSSKDNTLMYVAVGGAVLLAAGAYFVFAGTGEKKKKVKKAKPVQNAPSSATASASEKPPAGESRADKPAASPKGKATKSSKKSRPSSDNLQTSGQLPPGVLTKFFNASNTLLKKPETEELLIEAHRAGKDIGEELKILQEEEWRNLGIDPTFGMQQVQDTLQTKMETEAGLREALMTAAAAEESALMCGILGSRAKFDKEQARMKKLYEHGVTEFHRQLTEMSARGDRTEMEQFGREVMEKFHALVNPLNTVKTDVERIRLRLEMKDDDVIALIMGERLMQMQYEAQQQQSMAQGGGGSFK